MSCSAYSDVELNVLREIVHSSADANDGASFLAVFKAYDAVLKTHNIDPSTDRIYFKSLLKLARLDGATWLEKFDHLLNEIGISRPHSQSGTYPTASASKYPQPHHLSPSYLYRTFSESGIPHADGSNSSTRRPRSAMDMTSTSAYRVQSTPPARSDFTLTFDGDPRRYTILRQYWHAWRAKAIRRHSRLRGMVQVADQQYRSILLPVTLETWKAKWRYFAVLARRVERDRIRCILLRCLTWWKFRVRQNLLQHERRHNGVILSRAFSAWLALVRMKQEHLNTRTLFNVLERWKSKTSTNRDLREVAERSNRQRVLRRFWKAWFFQTCSVKTVQYYQMKLKQRGLVRWISRYKRLHKMQRLAHYSAIRKLATIFLLHWQTAARNLLDRTELTDFLRQRRILTTCLNTWRRAQKLSIRASVLRDKIDNRHIIHSWRRWKDLTRMTVHAESKANWSLLRVAFKGWRDDAVASRIETRIDHRVMSGAFAFWVIRQRGRLLQRVRDQRFLQEAFEIWKERYEGIHDALESTFEILGHARAANSLNDTLYVWRERLKLCDEQADVAECHHNDILRRTAMKKWRLCLGLHRRSGSEADHASYFFLAKRSLIHWRASLYRHRKERRQKILDQYVRLKRAGTLRHCLSIWNAKCRNIDHLQEIANDLRNESDRGLAYEALATWLDRSHYLHEKKRQAEEHCTLSIKRAYYELWRSYIGRLKSLEILTADNLLSRTEDNAAYFLRLWRMRIFQFRGQSMQADMFQRRSQKLKMRVMLRIWRGKVAAIGSDRAHTAPITPRRSTRRYLWKKPK